VAAPARRDAGAPCCRRTVERDLADVPHDLGAVPEGPRGRADDRSASGRSGTTAMVPQNIASATDIGGPVRACGCNEGVTGCAPALGARHRVIVALRNLARSRPHRTAIAHSPLGGVSPRSSEGLCEILLKSSLLSRTDCSVSRNEQDSLSKRREWRRFPRSGSGDRGHTLVIAELALGALSGRHLRHVHAAWRQPPSLERPGRVLAREATALRFEEPSL
jgi:hypothetical protein